jgi:hypothetical protein
VADDSLISGSPYKAMKVLKIKVLLKRQGFLNFPGLGNLAPEF